MKQLVVLIPNLPSRDLIKLEDGTLCENIGNNRYLSRKDETIWFFDLDNNGELYAYDSEGELLEANRITTIECLKEGIETVDGDLDSLCREAITGLGPFSKEDKILRNLMQARGLLSEASRNLDDYVG